MIPNPYKVYVVLDREFGDQLGSLPPSDPVWIVETPVNVAAAVRLRKHRNPDDHLTGITTFHDSGSCSRENLLIGQLDVIDLHHGPYSTEFPYTKLEVIGVPLNDDIRATLVDLGFNEFTAGPKGFSASRPAPAL